ncbi:MAG: serine/threonine-protein kinase [Sandaracinaceae bacterium]|nr:serine/threonine-protein kinase [Sandaracinaceae bacterium]
MDYPGRLIAGKYELVSIAGQGGMAVVWKALSRGAGSFRKWVAVKRIVAAKKSDRHFLQMFEEEARLGAELAHPNIVQILDFGRDEEEEPYLVMEWIEGVDLYQWIRSFERVRERTPWPVVVGIGIEVLRALNAAHERIGRDGQPAPVYHRDISPSNILLDYRGIVKLSDFGLARAMDRAAMTQPNVFKGKLAYCAPELTRGAKPSVQSDLFGLGVVLWESLAQRRLFSGANDIEVLLAIRKSQIPAISNIRPDVPALLDAIIAKATAAHPFQRFASAREMGKNLSAVLQSHATLFDVEMLGNSVRLAMARLGKSIEAEGVALKDGLPQANEEEVLSVTSEMVQEVENESEGAAQRETRQGIPLRGLWRTEEGSSVIGPDFAQNDPKKIDG